MELEKVKKEHTRLQRELEDVRIKEAKREEEIEELHDPQDKLFHVHDVESGCPLISRERGTCENGSINLNTMTTKTKNSYSVNYLYPQNSDTMYTFKIRKYCKFGLRHII